MEIIELINYIPVAISIIVFILGIRFVIRQNKKMNKTIHELLSDYNRSKE